MQDMLKTEEAARWIGLALNPKNCVTLHINCGKKREMHETTFNMHRENLTVLKDEEEYEYLEIPTG